MDVSLGDDQKSLQASARRLFAERLPADRLVEVADAVYADQAVDAKLWDEIVGLGWVGITAQGGDFTLEAVLLEEAGYALAPVPFLSSTIAAPAVAAVGFDPSAAATVAWAEPVGVDGGGAEAFGPVSQLAARARERDGGWVVSGVKVDVPDLQLAAHLVVAALPSTLYVVPRRAADDAGWLRAGYPTALDGTRRIAHVELSDAPATAVPDGDAVLTAVRRRAYAGLAAESVGVAQRALDLAAAHASTREQFGRPIGSYQAIAHRIADVYVAVELARSLSYRAAYWVAAAEGDRAATQVSATEVATACAAAKAAAGDAAVTATQTLIQVLGGMGMTWEHLAHRLYRRALADRDYAGTPAQHRATIAAALLD